MNALTAEAEVLFYRLLVVADDFGYMDARPAILKAQCFPLKTTATEAKIEGWLVELVSNGLIARYQTADLKRCLVINRWEQRVRSRPRYAGPLDDGCQIIDGHLSDICPTYDGLGKGKGKGKGATSRIGRELRSIDPDWKPSKQTVEQLSREFGLRVPEDVERYVAAFHDACSSKDYRYRDFDAAFRNCVRQDWPKFRQRQMLRDPTLGAV